MEPVMLTVDGDPPIRHDPGRCADRSSPNASPLFRAASAYVAAGPEGFPIREPVGIVVTSATPLPSGVGYGGIDPIIEVLADAGMLSDERWVAWELAELRPGMTGYSVRVAPGR
jgi:hypothetical protein